MRLRPCVLVRQARGRKRGFTLVELLTVVAIMGVLSAVAVTLVRQHFRAAKMTEGIAGVQSLRAAENARRAEVGTYWDCSGTGGAYYPDAPNGEVRSWTNTGHAKWDAWKQLALPPQTEGTRFGWLVNAGLPDAAMPTSTVLTTTPTWPKQVDPWYLIQGVADSDGDQKYAKIVASSVNNEVYTEDDTE